MKLEKETKNAINAVKLGTVAHQSMTFGHMRAEPLLFSMDGMLRYAKSYRKAYDANIADNGVLGPCYLDAIKGLRGLLNGQGVAAMEADRSQDSKDNGVIETIFWHCIDAGGFTEEDA